MKGIVKWFNLEKGYGFISPYDDTTKDGKVPAKDNKKDIFVHTQDVNEDSKVLLDGQHVEFDIEQNLRGRRAKNVVVIIMEQENKE